jgi:hypothetical protein
MLCMSTATSKLRARLNFAGQCSVAVAAIVIITRGFRAVMGHLFSRGSQDDWFVPVTAIAAVLGLVWFGFTLTCDILGDRSSMKGSPDSERPKHQRHSQLWEFLASLTIAGITALVLAISGWLALGVSDGLFSSRLLPWISALIWFQGFGFRTASRLFPCRIEGSVIGCECYKWVPTFLLSNTAIYFLFLLPSAFLYRLNERIRSTTGWLLERFLRWGSLLGVALLCSRLFFYNFAPEASLPTSRGTSGNTTWTFLDGASGTISVIFAMLAPFYLCYLVRAIWQQNHVRNRLIELTWIVGFLLAAVELGNQFLW